jgi:hypothetical protein
MYIPLLLTKWRRISYVCFSQNLSYILEHGDKSWSISLPQVITLIISTPPPLGPPSTAEKLSRGEGGDNCTTDYIL